MPTNYTIDDVSPLIQYSGSWSAGNKTDSLASKYFDGTFTLSTTKGSSASFTFTGSQCWIFGAKRNNHGLYTVKVDGGPTNNFNGFSSQPNFTAIFDSGSLSQGQHTVTITNNQNDTTRSFLDIDSITWSTESAAPSVQLDDNASEYSYQPSSSWSTSLPSNFTGFQNNNGHITQDKDASTTIAFAGDSIILYGAVGPNLGPYTIKIDNNTVSGTFIATNQNYAAQTALYQTEGLGDGNHTLEITNAPASSGQSLAIDFALVASAPVASGSTSVSTSATSSASASASATSKSGDQWGDLKKGLFIAAGISSVCLFLTFAALIYRCGYRRSVRHQKISGTTTDVAAFTDGGKAMSMRSISSQNPHGDSDTAPLLNTRSMA